MRRHLLLVMLPLMLASARAECPAPPTPQRDIIADGYYDDPPFYSHIDPVKHAAYEAAVEPLEAFMGQVASSASKGDKMCALRWLSAWAEGDAMLGKIEKEQAHYERKWILSGLALSYAKVQDAASRDQKASINAWLQALADGVRTHSEQYKGERNNHYYWEGLAVAAVGAVTGRKSDVEWGRKVLHDAESDIADGSTMPRGSLPRELRRGGRALHYHLFAAAPLVMLESILNEDSEKILMLVTFCEMYAHDYSGLAEAAGAKQIGILDDDYYWVVIYHRHHHIGLPPNIPVMIPKGHKPYVNRLGGDLMKPNPLEHVAQ